MAGQIDIDDQASFTNLGPGEVLDSIPDEADSGFHPLSADGLVPISQGNPEYNIITACFLAGLGPLADGTAIVSVLKNSTGSCSTKAKFIAFRAFMEAVARKNGGVANVKYGWFPGSKEEIKRIISLGFSGREVEKFANEATSHGVGVHLVPSNIPLAAALGAEPDEEGLRHLLLCRVIQGNPEKIVSGSRQMYPSSSEFHSGVDDLLSPRHYIIWSCSMNAYLLPSYAVTFRSPHLIPRDRRRERRVQGPGSTWVSFAALLSILSESLDPPRMNMILKTYSEFRRREVRRDKLVRKMREVAGDDLLKHIIKRYRGADRVIT